MRTAISVLAVMATVVLVVACFDPTRSCSTSSDCVNGGTCDSRTKTCVAAGNPDDKTPPVFSILVKAPPGRQNTAKLTEYDPGSPDGGLDAFRRDESVQVTVTSLDPDVDAGSVKLVAYGVAANPGAPADVQLAPCASANPAASNPFCREGTVQLATLPFEAFRGVVPLEVSGSDLSSNVGKTDAGLNVTRWKWRYSAGAPIYTTPAIADDGTIVFGTSDGGSGSVYALGTSGSEKWNPQGVGEIKASPLIGALDGGQQLAYVGTAAAQGRLLAVNVADGTTVAACPSTGGYGGRVVGTPAFVSAATSIEGALALVNAERLVNIRPAAPLPDDRCSASAAGSVRISQAFPSTIVIAGSDAYAGTMDGTVHAYKLQSGSWIDNLGFGGGFGYSPVGNALVQLALIPPSIIGTTSLTGVFSLDQSSGDLQNKYPDGGVGADPGGPIVAGGEYIFGGGLQASPNIYSTAVGFAQGSRTGIADAVVGTPVAGAGGLFYLATSAGALEARSAPAAAVWAGSLGAGESFLGSPTLGCGPEGSRLGVLYVGSTSGNFFAVIVDSPGLDPTSTWPKYQHDVRNTGNPTTPIQSCP
jgi:hypothetical protein